MDILTVALTALLVPVAGYTAVSIVRTLQQAGEQRKMRERLISRLVELSESDEVLGRSDREALLDMIPIAGYDFQMSNLLRETFKKLDERSRQWQSSTEIARMASLHAVLDSLSKELQTIAIEEFEDWETLEHEISESERDYRDGNVIYLEEARRQQFGEANG